MKENIPEFSISSILRFLKILKYAEGLLSKCLTKSWKKIQILNLELKITQKSFQIIKKQVCEDISVQSLEFVQSVGRWIVLQALEQLF